MSGKGDNTRWGNEARRRAEHARIFGAPPPFAPTPVTFETLAALAADLVPDPPRGRTLLDATAEHLARVLLLAPDVCHDEPLEA